MYDVYYALRLPPDGQIELQRHTTDFWNFFCLSEINTGDVQICQKAHPLLVNCMMFAPPSYRKFATWVDWVYRKSHFPFAGVYLTAVSRVASPRWRLCDHCLYLSSVLSWLIDVCIIFTFSCDTRKYSVARVQNIDYWTRKFLVEIWGNFPGCTIYCKTSWQHYQFQNLLTNTQRMHEK